VDWRHEIYGVRGRGNLCLCRQQSADELGLFVVQHSRLLRLLGVTEIVIALLIAARPLSARATLVGSASGRRHVLDHVEPSRTEKK
jgi:hypothetical protein